MVFPKDLLGLRDKIRKDLVKNDHWPTPNSLPLTRVESMLPRPVTRIDSISMLTGQENLGMDNLVDDIDRHPQPTASFLSLVQNYNGRCRAPVLIWRSDREEVAK